MLVLAMEFSRGIDRPAAELLGRSERKEVQPRAGRCRVVVLPDRRHEPTIRRGSAPGKRNRGVRFPHRFAPRGHTL